MRRRCIEVVLSPSLHLQVLLRAKFGSCSSPLYADVDIVCYRSEAWQTFNTYGQITKAPMRLLMNDGAGVFVVDDRNSDLSVPFRRPEFRDGRTHATVAADIDGDGGMFCTQLS